MLGWLFYSCWREHPVSMLTLPLCFLCTIPLNGDFIMCYRWALGCSVAGVVLALSLVSISQSIAVRYQLSQSSLFKTGCLVPEGWLGSFTDNAFSEDILADHRLQGLIRDSCFQEVTMVPDGSQNRALLLRDTFYPFMPDRGWLLASSREWASGMFFWDFVTLTSWGLPGETDDHMCSVRLCFAKRPVNSRWQREKAAYHTTFLFLQSLWNWLVSRVQCSSIVWLVSFENTADPVSIVLITPGSQDLIVND